jgi:ribosomal protein S18 acetylase RimI-like enzyme
MKIRLATMGDYAGMCAVLDEGDALHRQALPHAFRDPGGPARSRAYIASIIEDESACLWVAEHEGQIVGVLRISIQQPPDRPILVPRRTAVIGDLVVSQEHRRRGIGRALVEEANKWALERDITQMELLVWEFNEGARAFYGALGYQTVNRRMWQQLPNQG